MIELKEAVKIAKNFIVEMNGDQDDFQLEYVRHFESDNIWRVTYSFWRGENTPNQLQSILGINANGRVNRTIDINATSGEVIGMQMGTPTQLTTT